MHIQVINFNLEGINRAQYEAVCNELAEAFAALPGLCLLYTSDAADE